MGLILLSSSWTLRTQQNLSERGVWPAQSLEQLILTNLKILAIMDSSTAETYLTQQWRNVSTELWGSCWSSWPIMFKDRHNLLMANIHVCDNSLFLRSCKRSSVLFMLVPIL